MSTLQCVILIASPRTWMPSSCGRTTLTWSSTTPRMPSTVMPLTPPTTVTWLISTFLCATTMPPRTIAPGSPTSFSRRDDHERALVDARREVHDRRQVRVPEPSRRGERRRHRRDRERAAAQAELAAVLRVREPPERQHRVAEQLRAHPRGREQPERDHERRARPVADHDRHHRAELDEARAAARPSRAGSGAPGGRRDRSASATTSIAAARPTGHHWPSAAATRQAAASGSASAASRDSIRPLSVYDICAGSSGLRSARRRACRRRDTPSARPRPRPRASASRR